MLWVSEGARKSCKQAGPRALQGSRNGEKGV